jgi:hypothetical protein
LTGNLTSNGTTTTKNTQINGTLGVTGATSLGSTLAVTGATTLTGNLTSNGTTTTKNTQINGTLGVTGVTTLSANLRINTTDTAPVIISSTGHSVHQRGFGIFSPNMVAGEHLQISTGLSDSTRNQGYLRFGYSGTSGSNDNYLGLGFHSADDLIKIYPNRVESSLLQTLIYNSIYPVGFMVQTNGADPSTIYGGVWSPIRLNAVYFYNQSQNLTYYIIYSGTSVTVNIRCYNYQIGNQNITYDFTSCGFYVTDSYYGEIIPMHYEWIDTGKICQGGGKYVISKNNSTSFTVDSNYGNSNKNDYVLTFTTYMTNVASAIGKIGTGVKFITWLRTM